MSGYKDDLDERLSAAAKAKQAMLDKFRARQRPAPASGPDVPDAGAEPAHGEGGPEPGPGKARRK